MKKIALTITLSFLTVFSLLISTPQNSVQASAVESNAIVQQDSKFVTTTLAFNSIPPFQYYWNDGTYQGYIVRISYNYYGGYYHGVYAGDVYKNAPVYSKSTPILD